MEQPQYNMLVREKVEVEFSQIYKTVGLGTTIWSPLASGVLSGKYNDGKEGETRLKREELSRLSEKLLVKETLEKVKKLSALAKDLGMTMPQLGVGWCLKNENVSSVILGASKTSQLKENLKASAKKNILTPAVMEIIEKILENKPKHPTF